MEDWAAAVVVVQGYHQAETSRSRFRELQRRPLLHRRPERGAFTDVARLLDPAADREAAREIPDITRAQERWLKVVSALPHGPRATSARGINRTDWFRMDREFYDACLDPRDYRPHR